MCTAKTPKYEPPPAPPEPTKAPRLIDAGVVQARNTEAAQAKRAAGRSGTILTNPSLFGGANTGAANKTLLGQ
jgi:hypothetical protein